MFCKYWGGGFWGYFLVSLGLGAGAVPRQKRSESLGVALGQEARSLPELAASHSPAIPKGHCWRMWESMHSGLGNRESSAFLFVNRPHVR